MKKKKHTGISAHRLAQNPLEAAFAKAWQEQNDYSATLAYLLTGEKDWSGVSSRDILVAATIIQWLGSPVGQAFIEEVTRAP